MKFFLMISLLLPCSAMAAEQCADCDRHPAFTVPVPAIIPEFGARIDPSVNCMDFVRESSAKQWSEGAEAIEALINLFSDHASLNPITIATFAAIQNWPRSAETCAQQTDFRYVKAAFALKKKYLLEHLKGDEEMMADLNAPDSNYSADELLDKTLCINSCLRENREARGEELNEDNSCVKSCNVQSEFFGFTKGHAVISFLLKPQCFDPNSGKLDRDELLARAKKSDAMDQVLLASIKKAWAEKKPELIERSSSILAQQNLLEPKRAKRRAKNCAFDRVNKSTRQSVIRLAVDSDEGLGYGSGFYVSAPNGKKFLTSARHVPATGQGYDAELDPIIPIHGSRFEFTMDPGKYDFANDAVLKEVSSAAHSLKVVRSKELPKPGQNFIAFGYPASNGGKFTSIECKFMGFGPNLSSATSYFLHCPIDSSLQGMSGGPLLGEDGRVWGILVNQVPKTGLVAATPLSVDDEGEVQFGPQKTFLSDNCFGPPDNPAAPHRCQIFPGSLEKPVPVPK